MKAILYILLMGLFCISCTKIFEYSPYDTPVKSQNFNTNNFNIVAEQELGTDTVSFAFISDTHEYYDDLSDAIYQINKHANLQFIICGGDVSNTGLAQEYDWYFNIIKKSKYPVITIIGNHDYLSNGQYAYQKYFGPTNTTFVFDKYKFVLFDDVVWENNNKSPDFKWLETELNDSSYYNILLAHIAPWDVQQNDNNNIQFNNIVKPGNTLLCLYGHEHTYKELIYNGIYSVVSESINKRGYSIISLIKNKIVVKHYTF